MEQNPTEKESAEKTSHPPFSKGGEGDFGSGAEKASETLSRREFLKTAGRAATFGLGAIIFGTEHSEGAIPPYTPKKSKAESKTKEETIPGPDWVAEHIPGHPELDPVPNLLRDVGRHASDGSAMVWVGYDSESSPPRVGEAAGVFYYVSGKTPAGHIRLVLGEWGALPNGIF